MIYILTAIKNRKIATLDFLTSLKKQTYRDFKTVIVDDGSTDGSSEAIRKNYPSVKIIAGDGNLWWTKSVNLGLSYILDHSKNGDFILIANDDTVFDEKYIATLLEQSIANGRAVIGSICKNFNNKNEIDRGGILFNEDTTTLSQIFPRPGDKLIEVDTLTTRGVLVPVEVVKEVGFFDEKNFPHYVSDYDYFLRVKKAGFKLYLSNLAVVYNKTNLTGFRPADKKLSLGEIYTNLFSRRSAGNLSNEVRFRWKHSPSLLRKLANVSRYFLSKTIWIGKQLILFFQ